MLRLKLTDAERAATGGWQVAMTAVTVLALWVVPQVAAPARAQEPAVGAKGQDGFAYVAELTPRGPGPVHCIVLTDHLYKTVTSAQLDDLAVFNGAGKVVPHALRVAPAPVEPSKTVPVRFFREPDPAQAELSLDVHVGAAAGEFGLRAHAALGGPRAPSVGPYLVDLRPLKDTGVRRLKVDLAGDDDVSVAVSVERGARPGQWRHPQPAQRLVRLTYGAHQLAYDTLELADGPPEFVRLTGVGGGPLELKGVMAETEPVQERVARRSVQVLGTAVAGKPGQYRFVVPGFFPVDRVQVLLGEDNALLSGRLSRAQSDDGPSESLWAGDIYQVRREGRLLRSAPIRVAPNRSYNRYTLQLDPGSGALIEDSPKLELSFVPDQLLFIERGPAPMRLAYGKYGQPSLGFAAPQVLALSSDIDKQALAVQDTDQATPVVVAGEGALLPTKAPLPTRTLALWALLVGTAAVLLLVALRLVRTRPLSAGHRDVGNRDAGNRDAGSRDDGDRDDGGTR